MNEMYEIHSVSAAQTTVTSMAAQSKVDLGIQKTDGKNHCEMRGAVSVRRDKGHNRKRVCESLSLLLCR